MTRAAYGAVIGEARRLLATEGVCGTWQLAAVRKASNPGHALHRLVAMGEAVQVRGTTLYARPDVHAEIEAAITRTRKSAGEAGEERGR